MLTFNFLFTNKARVIPAVDKLCQLGIKTCSIEFSSDTQFKKETHPYKQIHPWKSRDKFHQYLLENVVYNKDGLVALNKPYGISKTPIQYESNEILQHRSSYVANSVNYTISESLPFLAKNLGYSNLIIAQAPEKYTSGVMLLAENENIKKRVLKSHRIALSTKSPVFTYWIVTTKLPREVSGTKHVAITIKELKNIRKPVIVHTWTNADLKKKNITPIHAEFKLLANSTGNLASLMELKMHTRKWHAVRLFAATELYSPILGDNVHGGRLVNIMNSWILANPFSLVETQMPVLQEDLMNLLRIKRSIQEIIPTHVHVKEVLLPMFSKKKDAKIEAPLPPYFEWTCKKLQFNLKKLIDDVPDAGCESNEVVTLTT